MLVCENLPRTNSTKSETQNIFVKFQQNEHTPVLHFFIKYFAFLLFPGHLKYLYIPFSDQSTGDLSVGLYSTQDDDTLPTMDPTMDSNGLSLDGKTQYADLGIYG